MTDIITDIIETITNHVPSISTEVARAIEKIVRQKWAGEITYICKRSYLIETKKQLIHDSIIAGYSIAQIEQKYDIPRSTIYRLINKKRG